MASNIMPIMILFNMVNVAQYWAIIVLIVGFTMLANSLPTLRHKAANIMPVIVIGYALSIFEQSGKKAQSSRPLDRAGQLDSAVEACSHIIVKMMF